MFGCDFDNGGYAIQVTKNRIRFAPDFKFDDRLVQKKYDAYYTINGKRDSPSFELLLNDVNIRKSDALEVWYARGADT